MTTFQGGVLVTAIRGAMTPLINKSINEQLAIEHKVLDGQAERKEVSNGILSGTC